MNKKQITGYSKKRYYTKKELAKILEYILTFKTINDEIQITESGLKEIEVIRKIILKR